MATFDPEQFLRAKAEELRGNPGRGRQPDSSSLASAAAALIAVGVLHPREAEQLLDQFDLEWDVDFARSRPGWGSASSRVGYISPRRLGDARVLGLDAELSLPVGTLRLRYAVLEQGHTAMAADFHIGDKPSTGLRDWIRVPGGMPSGLSRPVLLDESGMSRTLQFNGHGNDDRWSGLFFTDQAIPTDATWFELYGARIALNRGPVPASVKIEPVQQHNHGQMHLLRVLASADPFRCQDPEAAADALLAADAIASNDPVIALIKAAGDHPTERRSTLAYPKGISGLPEPWPTKPADQVVGLERTFVTGVTTDEFDGHQVTVLAIRSGSDGFVVEAEVTHADNGRSILEDQELIWWAHDDFGQNYLGTWNGSDRATTSGELNFFPALNPTATRLDLTPSAPAVRAAISILLTDQEFAPTA